jgi:hypothetical protein
MVTEKIFESALGVQSPWHIAGIEFEPKQRQLSIRVTFRSVAGLRLPERRENTRCTTR